LRSLPESIGNITSLKALNLSFNKLEILPESIGDLTSLKELDLNYNKLTNLPASISNSTSLKRLQKELTDALDKQFYDWERI